jgi:hypothetical protein
MRITSPLFEPFLKCPAQGYLRVPGETDSGNKYAVRFVFRTNGYEDEAARRLQETVPEAERVVAPPANEIVKPHGEPAG